MIVDVEGFRWWLLLPKRHHVLLLLRSRVLNFQVVFRVCSKPLVPTSLILLLRKPTSVLLYRVSSTRLVIYKIMTVHIAKVKVRPRKSESQNYPLCGGHLTNATHRLTPQCLCSGALKYARVLGSNRRHASQQPMSGGSRDFVSMHAHSSKLLSGYACYMYNMFTA